MREALIRHVDWLDDGLDGITLYRSEMHIWMFCHLDRDLSLYGMNSDLDILKIIFWLAKEFFRPNLLRPNHSTYEEQILDIEAMSESIVHQGSVNLNAHPLPSLFDCRVLTFCVTYDLLFYYELDIVRLYVPFTNDVNDMHYFAA